MDGRDRKRVGGCNSLAAGLALAAALSGCSRPTGAPGGRWPRFEVKTYAAAVDYQVPAMRLEMMRAQGEHPPKGGGAQPAPNPAAVSDRLRQIWLTPHGVVKAALAGGAPATANVFTFKAGDRDVTVTLNEENLVERVEYLITNSVVGDVPVEVTYSDYAEFGDIRFPRRIVEKQDGLETLDLTISDVQPNGAVSLPVPAKPIRYVVNTHAHYDHAGGLRQYVAEGITVITHESNKAFFEQAWARPRTVELDPAPAAGQPAIETVADKRVLSDRTRTVELYHLPNHQHHTGQLIAYLPKERILMYGDAYNPPAGDEIRTPDRGPEFATQMVETVQALKLNPERIAPVHGRAGRGQSLT